MRLQLSADEQRGVEERAARLAALDDGAPAGGVQNAGAYCFQILPGTREGCDGYLNRAAQMPPGARDVTMGLSPRGADRVALAIKSLTLMPKIRIGPVGADMSTTQQMISTSVTWRPRLTAVRASSGFRRCGVSCPGRS